MKINDDHMYHGAALTQIAEHPQFTAINAFTMPNGETSRNAFRINTDIGVYLKYASAPRQSFDEYQFTFQTSQLTELQDIASRSTQVFLALVCIEDRQICVLRYETLLELVARRRNARGIDESQYTVLVTLPKGSSFRVYVNAPGKRKKMLGKKALIVPRNDFPGVLFT